MTIKALPTKKAAIEQEVFEILGEAVGHNFDKVVVMGMKDGRIHTTHTSCVSRLELIGALEAAKIQIWEAD